MILIIPIVEVDGIDDAPHGEAVGVKYDGFLCLGRLLHIHADGIVFLLKVHGNSHGIAVVDHVVGCLYALHLGIVQAELERLEKERDNLKERLNDKVNTASSSFHVSSSTIFSALNSGSSAFYMSPVFNYSILDGIIEYKEKERREARRKGYLEAKRLYEEKIQKLKNHFEEVKANANRQLKQYAEDMGAILEEIHRVKIQIADLELAMME